MMNKVLLLDYGGVLGYDHMLEEEKLLAKAVGLTQDELNDRIIEKTFPGRDFRENRITELEFWRIVSRNKVTSESSSQVLTNMWMNTYSLNDEMMEFLKQLRQRIRVGILTNIDIGRSKLLKEILNVDANFDYYFPSFVFGYSKDTPQLWDLLNNKLKKDNDNLDIIYVDDRVEHVLSAKKIGWKGIRYYCLEQLKDQLRSLIQ